MKKILKELLAAGWIVEFTFFMFERKDRVYLVRACREAELFSGDYIIAGCGKSPTAALKKVRENITGCDYSLRHNKMSPGTIKRIAEQKNEKST